MGEEEGILEEEEGELIQSIIEFGDTSAGEVMTPRTDIVALPITATVREARDVMIESKYSRIPVYRDQIDNVEGLIYVRDLLCYWPEGQARTTPSSRCCATPTSSRRRRRSTSCWKRCRRRTCSSRS